MAEEQRGTEPADNERAPTAPELLRAAMEKVVFFEWRLGELAGELAAAQSRAAAAELESARAGEACAAAQREAQAARLQAQRLESERVRLAALLARPASPSFDGPALLAERARVARLEAELAEARHEIECRRAERDRWLGEMLAQSQARGDAPAELAGFISELRAEVIALREREKRAEELLRQAGIAEPRPAERATPPPSPRAPDAVERARALWSEGRLASGADLADAASAIAASPASGAGTAASALAQQCLRGLASRDAARREQAARHLAAVPAAAAAPALAAALGVETDSRARAQIARALVACGGAGAADVVARLQSDDDPLVRLAALEALCALPDRAAGAVEQASRDAEPAVRRRAAALALAAGADAITARLARDEEPSVRAAASPRETAPAGPPPAARDLGRDAVLAVQAAIFGLTDAELAASLEVSQAEASALAASLIAQERLSRRGKRLVAAAPLSAAQGGH